MNELLTLKDVAAVLRVSPRTARRLVKMYIPHHKICGGLRIERRQLDDYIKRTTVKPWVMG